ncbi:Alpha/Beta hydrolase protein [Ephemerocybe angulata]|uniref:Alpha/Beta hydrolase protein n=1 Tax=Ephemerocybe angulata TaxID=980116 RepID=A0A8H6IFQ9_9AGAR|nr:Alpha/Beta hydrolase protein [Tulosesus angulatus]
MSAKEYTEAWLVGPQSTQFYTRTYLPPAPTPAKAVLVAVHGFAEHVGRYTHFHPLVAKKGVAVFAFDQRGFGLTALDTEGKKSRGSSWGKTCWAHQMEDLNWAINHAKEAFKDTPIFLLGHSMGGGEALGFATQEDKSPHKATVNSLSGVIATSPLITQTTPAPKLMKWIGGKASLLAPYTLIPAAVKAEELSHDKEFNDAYLKDPLIKQSGTLKGLSDMLSNSEALLRSSYRRWPKDLPLFIVHGTDDKVTSHRSSEAFHKTIDAVSKKLTLIEGGFHELQNEPDGVKERLVDEIIQFVEGHVSSQSKQVPSASTEPQISAPAATEEASAPEVPKANL